MPASGPRYWIAQVLPFSYLQDAFQLVLHGNPPYGSDPQFLLAAGVFLVVGGVAAAALGRPLLQRGA